MDDGLEVVTALCLDSHGVALDLGFDFWRFVADQFGDFFSFFLVETFFKGDCLGGFEVAFGDFGADVDDFLALVASG